MNLGAMQAKKKERKRKADHTSALLGSLWLLRSRPDQVHDIHMRGGPQTEILTEFEKKESAAQIPLLPSPPFRFSSSVQGIFPN